MVVDPFTVLGAAGNIVQFVDFGCKLVRNTRAVARSSSGSSQTTRELSAIANDVKRFSEAIDSSELPNQLRAVAEQSHKLAEELLDILRSLEAHGKHRKWDSFLTALREIWHNDKISDFVSRLSLLQDRLVADMQFVLVDQQSAVSRTLEQLTNESRGMDLMLTRRLNAMHSATAAEIQQLHSHIDGRLSSLNRPADLDHLLGERILPLENLAQALEDMHLESKSVKRIQGVFKSLYFPRFATRHSQIPEAHAHTFSWAFQDNLPGTKQRLHFVDWLRSEAGVFWVRGKAGSGKSTFMKYVSGHPTTMSYLKEWAMGDELVVCKYFFWNAGTDLQKSQEGLLRTLLFELLKSSPRLIPSLQDISCYIESRISGDAATEGNWTLENLVLSLKQALSQCSGTRVCFFIDGLDEYKGESDTLIDLIRDLNQYQHVKTCVSSRPWVEFIDAFAQSDHCLIKLEDLTRSDIANYTSDRLLSKVKFRRRNGQDQSYERLVEEVTTKAQGVFLWVYLVVKSLLEGIRYADTPEDLQLRLETFPPDLEGFFKHMLDDIPQTYRRKTSQMFRLATIAGAPMPLMIYSFADDLDLDPHFAIKSEGEPMSQAEIHQRNEELAIRLDGRSKGLLEVNSVQDHSLFFKYEVDFLHRSVRDFLETSTDFQNMFGPFLPKNYDPAYILCHAHLAVMKLAPVPSESWNHSRLEKSVEGLFHFANQVQLSRNNSESLHGALGCASLFFTGPWSSKPWKGMNFTTGFISMAVQAGLVRYVDPKRQLLDWRYKHSWLAIALQLPWRKRIFPGSWPYSPEMVRCLIRHGEDPNGGNYGCTVWNDFLTKVSEDRDLHTTPIFEIIETLVVDGGAHLYETVPNTKSSRKPHETAYDVLRRILPQSNMDYILANYKEQPVK